MIRNYDKSVKTNYNSNWPYIIDDPHRTLITGGSGLGMNNLLLNLIKHQRPVVDKIYLYNKDSFE